MGVESFSAGDLKHDIRRLLVLEQLEDAPEARISWNKLVAHDVDVVFPGWCGFIDDDRDRIDGRVLLILNRKSVRD